MKTIEVTLPNRTYNIYIESGILSNVSKYLDSSVSYVIITDTNIPQQYYETLQKQLNVLYVHKVIPGEHSKSFKTVQDIVDKMMENGITRSTKIIAVGGGVVGDIAGFVASIYMRGIPFIQVPTSLLAQVDSSVGGKVGINTHFMKNGVGSFFQPEAVFIDPNTLKTLPQRHLNNGMAELIKHALIRGKSLYLELQSSKPFEKLDKWIYQSIMIKRDIVIQDEFDQFERQILNFGHTIGHAIEQYSNYELLHGEAISVGMHQIIKNTIFENDITNLLIKYNLPVSYEYNKERIINFIKTDKKVFASSIHVILLEEPGNAFIKTINVNEMKEYL